MHVLINIPEEQYEMIQNISNFISADANQLIRDGIPLPKGHGDLVDRDALEKEIVNGIKAGNYEEGYETFAHINDMDDCIECVKYADTIIEADKEHKDETS